MSAIFCPECGTSNPGHKTQCSQCEASLTVTTTTTYTPKEDGGFFAAEKKASKKALQAGSS